MCSSSAKCVSDDAICFDSYTCDYSGFICKSKFDELANEYDELTTRCKDIAREYDELVSCLSYASSLEDAQNCL